MILFVFEGERREPMLFKSIEHLFFSKPNENIICSFGNNIYELYRQMRLLDDGADIVGLMKETGNLNVQEDISDFSDVFLFFDLDIHNQNQSIVESKRQLREMLDYFDNETENGKLFVNYPMIESIYHTDYLPDVRFGEYTVKIDECGEYKKIARNFGPYANLDHLCVTERNLGRKDIVSKIKSNWLHLINMSVSKAAGLCEVPSNGIVPKERITQNIIFNHQDKKHIMPNNEIAVLNGFPLFLYDYFKLEALRMR